MKRVVRAGSPEIVKIAGDSSTCAAESSFRELDDVFLQTQTRIWLGEVLHIRFDEETAIADLLADGELLFQVSKVVWKVLLKKHAELKHSKVSIYERTSSGKSDGRYMPYPKVDSFLKICQILGLTGVDLFSPSDVVEKKDVRRVCMCIRSFSKKARSKNLNVPDFDIVTYTIAMPSDLVGGIRRYLEQSQYSSSSSTSSDPRVMHKQKSLGGRSTLHYDSYSESDEAESSFNEFEFQSPLQDVTYDANFSSLIKQDSAEDNSILDDDICDFQSQFRLDMEEKVAHKSSIQSSNHELSYAVHSRSFSSLIERHSDQDAGICFSDVGEAMWPLRNKINSFSSSTNGSSLHDLDEPCAVAAEESFVQSRDKLGTIALGHDGLQMNRARCSSAESDINLNHPKVQFGALEGPSSVPITVICTLGDDLKSERMVSSSKNIILESQHTVIYLEANEVDTEQNEENSVDNDEGNEESSITHTVQMDPNHFINEVPLAGGYSILQQDTSNLSLHKLDNDKCIEILDSSPNLFMESVDLDKKEMKNGLEIMSIAEFEVAQVGSQSRPASVGHKYANVDCTADNFSFQQENNPKGDGISDVTVSISFSDNVIAVEQENVGTNEYNLIIGENCAKTETNGSATDQIALVDGFACDNEGFDAVGELGVELLNVCLLNNPPINAHCRTISSSDLTLLKNDQVLAIELDSPSDMLSIPRRADSFTCRAFYELSRNEFKSSSPAYICPMEDGDNFDASTCHLSMDSDGQAKCMSMSSRNEVMTDNGPLAEDNKMYKHTAISDYENLSVAGFCSEGDTNMESFQVNDDFYHPHESNADSLAEFKESYTKKLMTVNSSHLEDASSQIELLHDGCRASHEQIPPLMENGNAEKELLEIIEPCLHDGELRGLRSADLGLSNESTDVLSVHLENEPVEDGATEATDMHDLVHHNSMACSSSGTFATGGMQSHMSLTCSTAAPVTERKMCNEDVSDIRDGGDDSIIDDAFIIREYAEHEAEDSGERKEPEECMKEIVRKLASNVEAKDRFKGNTVLKSVAGAMTLLGALFLIHHVRQKREKEKDTVLIAPQQNQIPSKVVPTQKKAATQKPTERPAVLYPGERLKL